MLTHAMVGSNDLDRSKIFYDAVLGTLGIAPGVFVKNRIFYRGNGSNFFVTTPINGEPATVSNGATIGFVCDSPERADAWHAAGVAHGGTTCEEPPGWREKIMVGRIYLAYLRDPDGNKLGAIHHP